jgi:hypothetical protein
MCIALWTGRRKASQLWSYDHVFDRELGWLLFTFCQVCLLVVSLVASIPIPPRPNTVLCVVCTYYSLSHVMVMYQQYLKREQCVREETAHLANLKSKSIQVYNLLKEIAENETGMAEKSSWDQANRRQKLGLVWRNRMKN